jgi:hypothetical protein
VKEQKTSPSDDGLSQEQCVTENQLLADVDRGDVIDVKTSIVKGELGYHLTAAIWWTLNERKILGKWLGKASHDACAGMKVDHLDDLPWLSVGDHVWESWSSEVVIQCYEALGAYRCSSANALNCWIRAVGGEADDFWGLHRLSVSQQLMVSLVERGGNPLVALKL